MVMGFSFFSSGLIDDSMTLVTPWPSAGIHEVVHNSDDPKLGDLGKAGLLSGVGM